MSFKINGELDFSPLLMVEVAVISRKIEADLIAQHFVRTLNVDSEIEFDTKVATIKIEDIEMTNATIAVLLKATGFTTYALVKSSDSEEVFTDYIIIRK